MKWENRSSHEGRESGIWGQQTAVNTKGANARDKQNEVSRQRQWSFYTLPIYRRRLQHLNLPNFKVHFDTFVHASTCLEICLLQLLIMRILWALRSVFFSYWPCVFCEPWDLSSSVIDHAYILSLEICLLQLLIMRILWALRYVFFSYWSCVYFEPWDLSSSVIDHAYILSLEICLLQLLTMCILWALRSVLFSYWPCLYCVPCAHETPSHIRWWL